MQQIEKEKERRKENGRMSVERRQAIQQFYEPLHPHLYKLKVRTIFNYRNYNYINKRI